MGDDIKIGSLVGAARVSLSASATLSASHALTGRSVVADRDHALATSWAQCKTEEEFRAHSAYGRFRAALIELKTVDALLLPCFRGRLFCPQEMPTSLQMGPPQPDSAKAGRYNLVGKPVLYLCDSVEGVLREVEDDGRDLWVQDFAVDVTRLRIVDTRHSADMIFPNQVFWIAEASDSRTAADYPTFSQLIAQLVSEVFDGMRVPGVRAAPDAHYSNIVMFRPSEAWKKWVIPTSPVLLRPGRAL